MTELEPAPAELMEADMRGCRFIAGEATPLRTGMFCGAPTAPGSAWCRAHHGVVWRATTRQRATLRKSGRRSRRSLAQATEIAHKIRF
jgi:hypothetical protein